MGEGGPRGFPVAFTVGRVVGGHVRLAEVAGDCAKATGEVFHLLHQALLDHIVLPVQVEASGLPVEHLLDRKSTRLNSSHVKISYAVFCLKKKRTDDVVRPDT